jgi:hypothetical protein
MKHYRCHRCFAQIALALSLAMIDQAEAQDISPLRGTSDMIQACRQVQREQRANYVEQNPGPKPGFSLYSKGRPAASAE